MSPPFYGSSTNENRASKNKLKQTTSSLALEASFDSGEPAGEGGATAGPTSCSNNCTPLVKTDRGRKSDLSRSKKLGSYSSVRGPPEKPCVGNDADPLRSAQDYRFLTLKEAATELNVPYWLLLRAANSDKFPTYTLVNNRRRVILSEVIAAIRKLKAAPPTP